MAQRLRCWTHDRKVVGSIPGPDCVCVLEQDTLFHIVPVHSAEAENEYQQKLGVNLAIDRRPIQGEYCTLSRLMPLKPLNATETGISSGLMSLKADRTDFNLTLHYIGQLSNTCVTVLTIKEQM